MYDEQLSDICQAVGQLQEVWRTLQGAIEKGAPGLENIAQNILKLLSHIELDNDLSNKREVYLSIAEFLQEHFHQPLPICLGTVHALCNEFDQRLLALGSEKGKELVGSAIEYIITISVYYEPLADHAYNRKIEIYFIKDGSPARKTVEENITWDDLPADVRNSRIRQGPRPFTFSLYSQGR
jgi:hypothetical protein